MPILSNSWLEIFAKGQHIRKSTVVTRTYELNKASVAKKLYKSWKRELFLNFSKFCLKLQTSFLAIAANTLAFIAISFFNENKNYGIAITLYQIPLLFSSSRCQKVVCKLAQIMLDVSSFVISG